MEVESSQDSVAILSVNRTYLYRLLQNFFGNEPTLEAISILTSDHTQTALSLLSIEKGFNAIYRFNEQVNANDEDSIDKVCSEYTRLFIGPTKLPAPPWESVYVSADKTIFTETTLKVRQCYLKYNFVPVHYRSEPDDHIGLELDFMSILSLMVETAILGNKISEAVEILKDQRAFLKDHLLVWVPQYVTDLVAGTSHPLYLGIASLLKDFLEIDLVVISEMLESL